MRAEKWTEEGLPIEYLNLSYLPHEKLAENAAISEEHGFIDYIVHPKAINPEVFVAFINLIADKLGVGDFALFLDKLIVHKTNDAKHLFENLNITENFNVPYCPQFNGIESYFSQLKATNKN